MNDATNYEAEARAAAARELRAQLEAAEDERLAEEARQIRERIAQAQRDAEAARRAAEDG